MRIELNDIDPEAASELIRIVDSVEQDPNATETLRTIRRLIEEGDVELLELAIEIATHELNQATANESELTPQERSVLNHILQGEHDTLLSASDIAAHADSGDHKIGTEYKSLRHRSHVSETLKSLTEKGYLGKIQSKGTVLYAPPRVAIRHWLTENGNPQQVPIVELAKETGVPLVIAKKHLDEVHIN